MLPLDQWVFNTEAHPLPVAGSAADAAASRHYLHWRDITAAHGAKAGSGQHSSAATGSSGRGGAGGHEGSSAAGETGGGGIASTGADGRAPAATGQPGGRGAAAAAAAAFSGCRQQLQHLHPLQAYIQMWRFRRINDAFAAAAVQEPEPTLVSNRPAAVNADIAVCEAELAALLSQERGKQPQEKTAG